MVTLLHTSSGKGVLLIDDFGNTYSTSLLWLKGFVNKESNRNFLIFTKLSGRTDKFVAKGVVGDPLSSDAQKARNDEKVVGDVSDW